jgi:hypothetical protein
MKLTWLTESITTCPSCATPLSAVRENLELHLPFSNIGLFLELFVCLHCGVAQRYGDLPGLQTAVRFFCDTTTTAPFELFEIMAFNFAGRWLEAQVQGPDFCEPWATFAASLEEASELAEAQAVRWRFAVACDENLMPVDEPA